MLGVGHRDLDGTWIGRTLACEIQSDYSAAPLRTELLSLCQWLGAWATDMDEVTVVTRASLGEPDEATDVSRERIFETEDTIVVQSRVAGGITTGWHHNGNRRVYGYVVSGHAILEYGPGGEASVELDAGDFVYVPPHTIRRVVNPTAEDWVVAISFVGSGPPAVSVDGPQSDTE